ncbi:MAG: FAD-dependent oxidoreductase [Rhodocyclales bacterium]|nr:FAD-dependent oxidoreductase [Rhodocyclales bacterium]
MTASIATNQTILVVGGGISGMTAALEAAECGKQVILVEKTPVLGGRTARLYRYFPKMCHPTCGLEINLRRLKQNRNVRLMTMTEVTAVSGSRGNYEVTLKVSPRYVNENCTACGKCAEAVTAEVSNPWNYGLDKMKAAYLPHNMAHPQRFVIDPSIVGTPEGEKAKAACPVGAVDLDMKEESVTHPTMPPGFSPTATTAFPTSSPASNSSAWPIRKAPPAARSCARATARRQRTSPSSSAPVPVTRTTCATARASAAWPR